MSVKKRRRKRDCQHWRLCWHINTTTWRLHRRLITSARTNSDNTRIDRREIIRKQKWEEKELYGRFKRLMSNISHKKMWTWLKKEKLRRETGSLPIAPQNNAIRVNHIKARINKSQQNSRCRLCGDTDET